MDIRDRAVGTAPAVVDHAVAERPGRARPRNPGDVEVGRHRRVVEAVGIGCRHGVEKCRVLPDRDVVLADRVEIIHGAVAGRVVGVPRIADVHHVVGDASQGRRGRQPSCGRLRNHGEHNSPYQPATDVHELPARSGDDNDMRLERVAPPPVFDSKSFWRVNPRHARRRRFRRKPGKERLGRAAVDRHMTGGVDARRSVAHPGKQTDAPGTGKNVERFRAIPRGRRGPAVCRRHACCE